MLVGLDLFPLWLSVHSVLHSKLLSGSASGNTLQYTLPTDLYPDPTLTMPCKLACAVQIGTAHVLPTSIKSTI